MSNYTSRSTEDLLRLRDILSASIEYTEKMLAIARPKTSHYQNNLDQDLEMYENVEAILLARTTSKEYNGNA